MWRCHCGEKNLSRDERCRACNAARLTHEETESPGRGPRRQKTVQVSFFGLGGGGGRGDETPDRIAMPGPRAGKAPPRALSDDELTAYYASERRKGVLAWSAMILAALAVVALVAWQIARPAR